MRIAFFTDAFLPQINGVVSYVIDTAKELQRKGHEVIIFVPAPRRGVKLDLSTFPFEVVYLPSLPAFFYPDLRLTIPSSPKVIRKLRQFKAQVIHIQDPFFVGTEGFLAAKLLKIPSAITFHTFFLDEDMLKNIRMWRLVARFKNSLWRLTAHYHNLADIVICPSYIAQKELIKYGLKKRSLVINNGVDLEKVRSFNKNKFREVKRLYKIRDRDKVGIYVGRLSADKCLDILIQVWKLVKEEMKDAKLLIVGGGPWDIYLKKLSGDLNLTNNVIFTGPIEHEEIFSKGIYKMAKVFVTASRIENQSISMIEAMASGLPIIAMKIRGVPELVDKTNGILVSSKKPALISRAIISLLHDNLKIRTLGKGSIAKSDNYDIRMTTAKLEDVYKRLIS